MLKRIRGEYDVVIASRYVMEGGIEEWSLWRKVISKLKKLIREMKLSNIILTGRISEYEKAELLQKAWVMLCISEMEGWDIIIMETTSCATPTIAYNIGALKVLTSIFEILIIFYKERG